MTASPDPWRRSDWLCWSVWSWRRRAGARRRLRLGADHRGADRASARRPGDRRRRSRSRWSQAARERLAERPTAGACRGRVMDLLELELEEPVDAILSTATFHWIADHERLFARLHARAAPGRPARRPVRRGGQHRRPARARRRGAARASPTPSTSPTCSRPGTTRGPSETRERLLAAGFAEAECWLQPAPQRTRARRASSSRRSCSARTYQQLPEELREPFMDEVMDALGEPVVVDYVRLNIDAWPELAPAQGSALRPARRESAKGSSRVAAPSAAPRSGRRAGQLVVGAAFDDAARRPARGSGRRRGSSRGGGRSRSSCGPARARRAPAARRARSRCRAPRWPRRGSAPGGLRRTVRAIAMRCFSPPEKR